MVDVVEALAEARASAARAREAARDAVDAEVFALWAELRHRRETAGFTQGNVADATGLSRTQVVNAENGRGASLQCLVACAGALGLKLDFVPAAQVGTRRPSSPPTERRGRRTAPTERRRRGGRTLGVKLDLPAMLRACRGVGKEMGDIVGTDLARHYLADEERPGIDELREIARSLGVPAGRLVAPAEEPRDDRHIRRHILDFFQDFYGYLDLPNLDADVEFARDLGIDPEIMRAIRSWNASPTKVFGGLVINRYDLPIGDDVPEENSDRVVEPTGRDVRIDPDVLVVWMQQAFATGPGKDETPPGLTRLARGIDIDDDVFGEVLRDERLVDERYARRISNYLGKGLAGFEQLVAAPV